MRTRVLQTWADEHGLWHATVSASTEDRATRHGRHAIRCAMMDADEDFGRLLIVETLPITETTWHVFEF